MPYTYRLPSTVTSPRDCVYNVKVFFDGGVGPNPYSLAIVNWQGTNTIAIRWNVSQREWDHPAKMTGTQICLGEPNSRGYPTWFILPLDFLKLLLSGQGTVTDAVRSAIVEIQENVAAVNGER